MPIGALWSLVIGLALLALGLTYKVAELTHRADRINKEAETLRSELNTLQKSKDKEISGIKVTPPKRDGRTQKRPRVYTDRS